MVQGQGITKIGPQFFGANRQDKNTVLLKVEDNGIGFTRYKLAKVQEKINSNSDELRLEERGFGLENVNKRIKLYYGKEYGLSIESEYQVGTRITLVIPTGNGFSEK